MIGNIGIEEEHIDILNNISKFHFNFNEKDFLEFAKYDINFIYYIILFHFCVDFFNVLEQEQLSVLSLLNYLLNI